MPKIIWDQVNAYKNLVNQRINTSGKLLEAVSKPKRINNMFKKDCPHCIGTGKTNRHGADGECTCADYEKPEETKSVMDFFAGGWKKELGKRSNIRIYDERGLSNQDYLGQ